MEKIYNEVKEETEIENKIKDIEVKIKEYNNCCDCLLLKNETEIEYEYQIYPKYIDKLMLAKYEILIYEVLLKEKEKIDYWKILLKKRNIDIYYKDNNKYKLNKGDSLNSNLYFKNKIDDKNKKKLSVINIKIHEKKELKDLYFLIKQKIKKYQNIHLL